MWLRDQKRMILDARCKRARKNELQKRRNIAHGSLCQKGNGSIGKIMNIPGAMVSLGEVFNGVAVSDALHGAEQQALCLNDMFEIVRRKRIIGGITVDTGALKTGKVGTSPK
ncbi:hypothetical protein A2532_04610 [Candidatus Wolfebacteria bacterium RIFOXYD2_FULL_48_11]|nr:MAG: hypothetical protein A2532_04610 [Candidatus Wolfebacteria bacterium RIFOXYD2_FULL_48_11]